MEQNQIQKFDAKTSRDEVLKQIEQMKAAKFVQLPETFKESVYFAIEKIAELPEIEKVPAIYITKALIKVFKNKLDFTKNHCYFFVQNDKESPTGKSLRFGWQYQGLIAVAKRDCNVHSVTPVIVYENDIFETHYEFGALIIDNHTPAFEGVIKGGYCVVSFDDGTKLVKYFTKKELDQRRDKSMAKSGKFWAWEREMYEKTLINATLKRIIETSSESEADTDSMYDEPEQTGQRISIQEVIPQPDPKNEIEPNKEFKM